ncbi:glycerophosphodiester phosphodiesterase [Proteus mirabilis]|uniref:glycerophosphodiester phosphodiesterase n=1 Tax=Proteus mirabilis TaxID=584 RepID=UPI003101880E
MTVTFKNVAELQASNLNVGDIARTLGLRNPNDGGGTVYRIISSQGTRPEGKGYKVTEYPFEYGDVRIANGNIAKRVTSVKKPDKVKFWAHRGGQREFAENTMFAFSQAIDNGAYGVELDLSMSSDGIWHVYHDASLYILTNGTDYIYNRDSEYLRGLTFNKLKNTKYADLIKIPTFSEFLSWAKENNIQFSAEFKNPRPGMVDEDIRAGIQMIVDSGCELQSRVAVTTNIEALRVRELSNDIKLWWSVPRLTREEVDLYSYYNNLELMLFTSNIDAESEGIIKVIHALGCEVITYTSLNTEDDLIKAINVGIDHVVSDRGWENKK